MLKNFLLLTISLIVCLGKINAQEQATYSQYQLFPVLINPALTGFQEKHEVLMNVRSQWSGFPGAPKGYTLMYNGPVGDKLSLGGSLFNENIGNISKQRFAVNYGFRYKFGVTKVGVGLSTEFNQVNLAKGVLQNGLYDDGDRLVEGYVDGVKVFDASAGIHAFYNEQLFIGLAFPNMIRARLDAVPGVDANKRSGIAYIFNMGYVSNVKNLNCKIIPSIALRKIYNVPYQVDLNLRGEFLEQKLMAGVTLRPSTGGSSAFMIGTKLHAIQFHYSYDVSFQRFQKYNTGSHELSLMFDFARKQKRFDASERFK
jgi:type IX secretion system PorP/SprF family membrane protein